MFIQNFLCSQPRHFCRRIDKVNVNSFVSYCSIFKELSATLSGDLIIISHLSRFVKRFLEIFQKTFFQPLRVIAVFRAAYILYHFLSILSRGFSNFFEIFLTSSCDTCPFKRICPPFQRRSVFLRLCYYITIFALCQQLFQNFFISVHFIYCKRFFHTL